MRKGLRSDGAKGAKLHVFANDILSVLPALLVPKEGLSEAVVWGRWGWVLCYIGGTTRPVIAGEKEIYKIYNSTQSGLVLYIQQLFVLSSVKACEGG